MAVSLHSSDRQHENTIRAQGLHSAALLLHTRALPQFPQGPSMHLPGWLCESHTTFGIYAPRLLPVPKVVGGSGLLVLECPTWGVWPTVCPWCPIVHYCVPSGSRTAWADAQMCIWVDSGTPSGAREVALPSVGLRSLATRLNR